MTTRAEFKPIVFEWAADHLDQVGWHSLTATESLITDDDPYEPTGGTCIGLALCRAIRACGLPTTDIELRHAYHWRLATHLGCAVNNGGNLAAIYLKNDEQTDPDWAARELRALAQELREAGNE